VLNSSHRRISLLHESLCNVCGDCNLIGLRPEEVPRVYPLGRKNHLGMQFMVKRLHCVQQSALNLAHYSSCFTFVPNNAASRRGPFSDVWCIKKSGTGGRFPLHCAFGP
jgi:hypothetical protein